MPDDKKTGYTVIDNEILDDKGLSIQEQSLLIALISYYNQEKGYAFPSYKQLMRRSKIKSRTTFINTLNALLNKKYVKKETLKGRGCKYFINNFIPGTDIDQVQKCTKYINVPTLGTDIDQHQVQNCTTTNTNTNTNTNTTYSLVIKYLNDKAGTNYRDTTKKTQSLINARIKEGFTSEDFKKVIDIKTTEWKKTDMEKYLRPETLFGTKFEGYLNQKVTYKENESRFVE